MSRTPAVSAKLSFLDPTRSVDGRGSTTLSYSRTTTATTLTTGSRLGERQTRQKRREPCWSAIPRFIVETKVFVTITSLLTVYALIGDDIRLLCTQRADDYIFDSFTIACLVVFTAEIILSTLGKSDYFLSFFFLLDILSTGTLVLDLSEINEMLQRDEEDMDGLGDSRTVRFARVSRVVRVIRLVRILKLYKAILAARQARRRREGGADPGDYEDWEDVDVEIRRAQLRTESRVAKKLSELTTRRVICLVLMMMLVLPYLESDTSRKFPTSAHYGADSINEAFKAMERHSNVSGYRTLYEKQVLQFIYYHNWFNRRLPACPHQSLCSKQYFSHVFWVGIVSTDSATATAKAQEAALQGNTVEKFGQESDKVVASASSSWMYNYGTMPRQVQAALGLPWDADCPYKRAKSKKYRLGFSLLGEVIDGSVMHSVRCPDNLRRVERKKYTPRLGVSEEVFEDWHFAFYFDLRPFVHLESKYSLCITLFVCLSLLSVSLFFSNDANRLVLYPVENMISKVDTFRKDPLAAMKVADEEFNREEMQKAKARKQEKNRCQRLADRVMCKPRESESELMETVILEKTIIKLGSLLALGFGEAGANIIAHNLRGADSANVVVMVEGTKVECIIGATRIRDFSIATEVLQADVMVFVNQIAEIVHGVVDEFHGAANKNSGDSFLTIWRTSDKEEEKVRKMADMAMVAFTKILGAVHRSPVLATYRSHPGLKQRLGRNCRVNLSSGLHYGWAIEGAVGSEFKIDASYLSPNVNIAESIERATQIYSVSILVAESVVKKSTPNVANKCRLIDRVVITGSSDPMELYVVDLDFMSLMVEQAPPLQVNWTSRQRFRVRQFLEAEKAMKWHEDVHMVTLFNENTDVAAMRFRFTLEFIHVFDMGYQNYIQGEWQVAQRLLSRTRTMLGVEDGPSNALLRFMETHGFKAPENWDGVRLLEDLVKLG